MTLQSLRGVLALIGYGASGMVATFYFAEISNVRNIPFLMRFSILAFVIFNAFTVLSALDRVEMLAPELPRAMAELLLTAVLFWRALHKRSERKCLTSHSPI